jgi:hypothetical protein
MAGELLTQVDDLTKRVELLEKEVKNLIEANQRIEGYIDHSQLQNPKQSFPAPPISLG